MAEHTINIKSSKTQFYPPDLDSKMFSKPASGLWRHKSFLCDRFGGSWSSNRVFMEKLWPLYGYNITGQTVNTTFKVSWSHQRAILHHSEWPIIFRVNEHNWVDVLCTLLSWNSASARERVRVVAWCAIEASILGFRCNEQPPPSLMTEPLVFIVGNGRMVHCSVCYCPYIIP